jgi:hypothetical protein
MPNFQARFSASAAPEFRPRAPNGAKRCAAYPEAVGPTLVETVDGHPDELVRGLRTDDRANPAVQPAVGALGLDIGVRGDLPVHAPYPIRLRVDQHLAPAVPGWVEEETPLVGVGEPCANVTDQEEVLMTVAGEVNAEQMTDR